MQMRGLSAMFFSQQANLNDQRSATSDDKR
jgi:hypothetical protein